jgi:hypothetical protein
MKKLAIAMLLVSSPAMAQQGTYIPPVQIGGVAPQANTLGQPVTNGNTCYPIGKTSKGDLVYSMDCQNMPVGVTYPTGPLTGSGVSGTPLPPSQTSGAPTGSSFNTPPTSSGGNSPQGTFK